jgi:hypothetical protein
LVLRPPLYSLLLLLVVSLLVGVALASAALLRVRDFRYRSGAGDAPEGAPDITSMWVSSPSRSKVRFRIAFANRRTMVQGDLVDVYLDSDRNKATAAGAPGWDGHVYGYEGVDYEIFVSDELPNEATVWGPTIDDTAFAPVSWHKRAMSFTLDRRLIGNPRHGFEFAVTSTGRYTSDAPTQQIPRSGMYAYALGR